MRRSPQLRLGTTQFCSPTTAALYQPQVPTSHFDSNGPNRKDMRNDRYEKVDVVPRH